MNYVKLDNGVELEWRDWECCLYVSVESRFIRQTIVRYTFLIKYFTSVIDDFCAVSQTLQPYVECVLSPGVE